MPGQEDSVIDLSATVCTQKLKLLDEGEGRKGGKRMMVLSVGVWRGRWLGVSPRSRLGEVKSVDQARHWAGGVESVRHDVYRDE